MNRSAHRRLAAAALVGLLPLAMAGCQRPPARSRADTAANSACRVEVDRVYAAQNRAELSQRDQRDSPFAASYLPGITSRDLGARFSRDNMVSSCVANSSSPAAAAPDLGAGPVFSPVAP